MSSRQNDKPSPNLGWRALEIIDGQFGGWPLKAAAAALGVPPETLRAWRERRSKPNTDHLSHLFGRLGSGFMAAVMSPFEEAHLDAREAKLDAEIASLLAEKRALAARRQGVRAVARNAGVEGVSAMAKTGGEDA